MRPTVATPTLKWRAIERIDWPLLSILATSDCRCVVSFGFRPNLTPRLRVARGGPKRLSTSGRWSAGPWTAPPAFRDAKHANRGQFGNHMAEENSPTEESHAIPMACGARKNRPSNRKSIRMPLLRRALKGTRCRIEMLEAQLDKLRTARNATRCRMHATARAAANPARRMEPRNPASSRSRSRLTSSCGVILVWLTF